MGLLSPGAEWTRGGAVRSISVAGVRRHHRRRCAQHVGVVTFVRGGDLVLHLALAWHVRPVTEHGHAPARPHADQNVRFIVDVLAAIAPHGELSSGSALGGHGAVSVFEGLTSKTNKGSLGSPFPWASSRRPCASSGTTVLSPEFKCQIDKSLPRRPAMASVDARQERWVRSHAHPEEWLSIIFALGGALLATAFFWGLPQFEPQSGLAWTVPGWVAFTYLFFQMLFLLVSATQIRALGVLDSIISIVPFVAGLVTATEWLMGHLNLSTFQINGLATMLAAGLCEFLLTVWGRFVVYPRAIGHDAT